MEKSYDSDENGEEDNDKYLRDTKIFVALQHNVLFFSNKKIYKIFKHAYIL